jgi:MYXO-CTERM domain-containing protein
MFRSRVFNWVAAMGLLLGMGCGADAGCGCDIQPLPAGGLPADQTIEGGMQVRVTRNGFDAIEDVVRAVVNDSFGDGLCVGKVGAGILIADVEACYNNSCTGGAQGCQVNISLDDIQMSVPDPDTFHIRVVISADTSIPARLLDPFFDITLASCTLDVDLDMGIVDLYVGFFIDSNTGELDIALQDIDINLSGFNSSGCGFISDILDFVIDVLSGPIGGFLIDLLTPVIEDLIKGFLPDPLGIEGLLDVGAMIGSVSPGTNALLEAKLVPGGYVSLPAEGLSLGLITGFNADEDIATRTPDLDSEPAFCVPPFAAPDFAAAPHNLALTARNTFKLDPANEFLGQPDPANDLVIGVSETFLDLTGHHMVSSGALCIGVGTELIPQLNLGLIGLLVPSLAELGSDEGDDPLMLVLRPTKPLDFTIGTGTEEDPSITIHFVNLDVDFYGFLFERFVRGFTIRLTMDVGLNLEYTLDDEGNPALEPQIVGLSADEIQLTVHNEEFLREGAAQLEQVLPSIFDLALPLISDGLGAFTLPDIVGFTLADIDITKVTTVEDDFLALYASLVPSMSMMTMFGDQYDIPGGQLESYVLNNQLAPVESADTGSTLTRVYTPAPSVLRAWMANQGGELPQIELDLDTYDAQGRQLEWSWRLNGGFWHAYRQDPHLVIQERQLALQGHHTVEVKARAVGQPRSVDRTPTKHEFIMDSAGPRIHIQRATIEGDHLIVTASDLVMPDDTIELAFGVGADAAEPDTDWMREGKLSVLALRALMTRGYVTVFARDELGNVSSENLDAGALLGFHGRASDSGCNCEVGQSRATGTGVALLGLFMLVMLARGRRIVYAVRRAVSWRKLVNWLPMIALFAISSFTPACSCDADSGGGPACEVDQDCADFCPDGQVGICFMDECLCSDDIPFGNVGQYSDLGLSSSSTAWVSAYNNRHGDLMIARWPESGPIPDSEWEFVDGVPDGPIALPDSDIRGGIFEPGEDVGLYTSLAVSASDVVNVSYFDKTNASLKYATNVNGTWELHTVDKGTLQGDPELGYEIIGQYSSITVRSDDGRPGIAYFAQIYEGASIMRTELRFAAAQTATPTSTSDWAKFIVDEITVELEVPGAGEPDPYIIPEGVGLFVHATRGPDQAPVLAYYDRVNGDLKLVRFDSVAGIFSPPVVIDGAADTDVGWYPSVTMDGSGVAHLSYLSATSDDLMYINDADLVAETVDDGYRIDGQTEDGLPQPVFHFVGDDSGIVITTAGPVVVYQDATTHELLLAQKNAAGNWEHQTIAGDEDPFVGGYGFYASTEYDGTNVVISNWVIDQPAYDSWVEIHRKTVVVE